MTNIVDSVTLIGALPPLKGNAYYCASLAKELSKKINVEFISFRKLYPEYLYPGGEKDLDPEFQVKETGTLSIRRLITYYNPFSWIWAGFAARNKIVHLQWWSMPVALIYIVILIVLRLRRKTIMFTIHNIMPHEKSRFDKILTKLVLGFGQQYFVHSQQNAKTLCEMFGFKDHQIVVIPMPVHNMYSKGSISKDVARFNVDIPMERRVLLCFGNIRRYKGIDDLLRAFQLVLEHEPKAYLLIVGQAWVSWDRYQSLIRELKLQHDVKAVLEYVPMSRVKYYFSSADLVVLPYKRFDAQSGVGNIALAFGLPLVVTDVGGLSDLVKDRRAIVEPGDFGGLANAITTILIDHDLEKKLSNDAKALSKQYSWGAFCQKTIASYKKY